MWVQNVSRQELYKNKEEKISSKSQINNDKFNGMKEKKTICRNTAHTLKHNFWVIVFYSLGAVFILFEGFIIGESALFAG